MPYGYVPLANVGCGYPDNPWAFYPQGVDTMFMFPQTLATFGRARNTSVTSTMQEAQAFYADQVRLGGWTPPCENLYVYLYSTSYPGNFLPRQYNAGMHIDVNSDVNQYNLGQIYLNNAFTWTFIKFNPRALALVPFNRMDPSSYPVPKFVSDNALPIGLMHMDILANNPKENKKYGRMIELAINEALKSKDGLGPCGRALTYICQTLDIKRPKWKSKNVLMGRWWNLVKEKGARLRQRDIDQSLYVPWTWPEVGP